jgi:hypothetical protein
MSGGWPNKLQVQLRQEPCVDKEKYFFPHYMASYFSYFILVSISSESYVRKKKLSKRLSW